MDFFVKSPCRRAALRDFSLPAFVLGPFAFPHQRRLQTVGYPLMRTTARHTFVPSAYSLL